MSSNLEKTCRCCLKPAENGVLTMSEHLLFDDRGRSARGLKIIDSYHELCVDPALISRGSLLICSSCRKALQNFVIFRELCQENNEKYQNLWQQAETTKHQVSIIYNERRVSTQELVSEVLMVKAEVKSEPETDYEEEKGNSLLDAVSKRRKIEPSERLDCLGCTKTFPNERSLRHHITKAVHNGIKSRNGVIKNAYNCPACGMEFQKIANMEGHLRKEHPDEVHFPCFYCKKSFPAKSLYQRDFEHLCAKQKLNYIMRQGSDEPTIDCELCDEKFYEEDQMLCHRITDHVDRKKSCVICKLDFRTRKSFYGHMKQNHPKEYEELEAMEPGKYICSTCGKDFTRRGGLKIHIETVHLVVTRDVKCPKCPSTFRTERSLKIHMKLHGKPRNFECNECGNRFVQLKTLHSHLLFKHFRSSCRFHCTICDKRFISNCKLKRHMGFHQGPSTETTHQCQLCELMCKTEKGLQKHIEVQHSTLHITEKKLFCKICNIPFRIRKPFYEHMEKNHPDEFKQISMEIKSGRYVCSACGKDFARADTLKIHFASVHCDKPREFQCTICSLAFKHKRALNTHVRLHEKQKVIECNECGQRFRELRTLRSHLFLIHFRSCCKFSCNVCEKRFVSNFELTRHMRLHTGVKNNKCEFCDTKYASEEGLKRHIQIKHTNLRYECKICDRTFTMKNAMWEHAFMHRGYFPYNCTACSKGFYEKNRLRKHLETKHSLPFDDAIHGYNKETFDQVVASCVKIDANNAVHFRGKRAVSLMSNLNYLSQLAKENSQQSEGSEILE